MTTRVIVFGSRNWSAELNDYIWARLRELPERLQIPHYDLLVVHGACRTGADAVADAYCVQNGIAVERHPAVWRPGGPGTPTDLSAGPRRNAHMAELGARHAVGFRMPGKSDGTDGMWGECTLRNIPVDRHGWGWPARW